MKIETRNQIKKLLVADETIAHEVKENIWKTVLLATSKRKYINARQATEILEVSRPTLRSYVKQGKLTQINLSSRKVRFDEQEVLHLANTGIKAHEN